MANFFKKNAKLLLIIYGVILFATLISGLFYMTNLADVHVYYSSDVNGPSFSADDSITSTEMTNYDLFYYFSYKNPDLPNKIGFTTDPNGLSIDESLDTPSNYFSTSGYAKIVYDFQMAMSNFNTQIIIYSFICLICFALLLVFSNHSRKIYYKSNLCAGILVPVTISIYTIIMVVQNFVLLGTFTEHFDLFRVVSVLQDSSISSAAKNRMINDYQSILENSQNFGPSCYYIETIFFAIVFVYSLFVIGYTIFRYKDSAQRRNEILERAVQNND